MVCAWRGIGKSVMPVVFMVWIVLSSVLPVMGDYVDVARVRPRIVAPIGTTVRFVSSDVDRTDVFITSDSPLSEIKLVWNCDLIGSRLLGDHWERAYGDLEWRTVGQDRVMPWYFLAWRNGRTDGYGVMVQPNAFASWQTDGRELVLTLDVRAGGVPVELKGRMLKAVTLVSRKGKKEESAFQSGMAFCRMMCPSPRLPKEPVYGFNDWYCAYGSQTATNFLRDARNVVDLTKGLANRPYVVVDDGWQINTPVEMKRRLGHIESGCGPWEKEGPVFGQAMSDFFRAIARLDAKPGLWYRPLKAWPGTSADERLMSDPDYFDPTVPKVRARLLADMRRFVSWGAKLVKIDYLTYDMTGTWPHELKAQDRLIVDGRRWRDNSRTTVEVMKEVYATLREGAGEDVVIIGCNAINHLAAGMFEVQRTGNDTSGRRWSQTRKYGVNALGFRAVQNMTFFQADPDCVGLATKGAVSWANNAEWMEAVARSGQSLFVSWHQSLMDANVREAFRKAFAAASMAYANGEPLDWMETNLPRHWRFADGDGVYDWRERTNDEACELAVPVFECPVSTINQTYDFRWKAFRRHCVKTSNGWVITEFLPKVPWAGPYNTIVCPAGHHLREARWLQDPTVAADYARFWFGTNGVHRRKYSSWLGSSLLDVVRVSGDVALAKHLLDSLVSLYEAWENDPKIYRTCPEGEPFPMGGDGKGMFTSVDDREGSEYSLGRDGYRPLFNAAMWGEARAIIEIASLGGRHDLMTRFIKKAETLGKGIRTMLWNPDVGFFTTVRTNGVRSAVRELHGYAPWYFGMSLPDRGFAFEQLFDEQGFSAPYGLTFAERRAPGFKVAYTGHECQWNGPSWPFATSVALTGLSHALRENAAGALVKEDFVSLLTQYAAQHVRKTEDGRQIPWIDEDLDPFTGEWISRRILRARGAKEERGEDYNHSTFADLVIAGLCGMHPNLDGTLDLMPLVPSDWDYFKLENVRIHRRMVSIYWDRTGDRYGKGIGFSVYVDGVEMLRHKQPQMCRLLIDSPR